MRVMLCRGRLSLLIAKVLEIRLFGQPSVSSAGGPIKLPASAKSLPLLLYLLLHQDEPLNRRSVAFTLWPDHTEDEAKATLRRHLHLLQKTLPHPADAPWVVSDPLTILWRTSRNTHCDVTEFQALSQHDDTRPEAVELYLGDLMEGFEDEWIAPVRESLREIQIGNLDELMKACRARGDLSSAFEYAQRLLRMDPFREDAVRSAMAIRHELGDRAGALRFYGVFEKRLRDELGAEPMEQTRAIRDAIATSAVTGNEARSAPKRSQPSHNIPLETTSFVGRRKELAELDRIVRASRIATIVGAGGVGKSRLALRLSNDLLSEYSDGSWLIQLASLHDDAMIISALLGMMGLNRAQDARLALKNALRDKKVLLVFDNCERLISQCANLFAELLQCCNQTHILATSREPIGLTGETILRLPPLDISDAERLFLDRAADWDGTLAATTHAAAATRELCRRLDGIPLALELAAARISVLTVEEILAKLDDRFNLLTKGNRTGLPHQQTLRATIDWTYHLLSEPEKTLFRRVAVFSGGWTLNAAEEICHGRSQDRSKILDILGTLVDKSFIVVRRHGGETRYSLLDTLHDYALQTVAREIDATHKRHLEYFARLAEQSEQELKGPQQRLWLDKLEREHDNFRAALQRSAEERSDCDLALKLAANLSYFWLLHSYFAEGRRWLKQALSLVEGDVPVPLHAKALTNLAMLAIFQNQYREARDCYERALMVAKAAGDQTAIAQSLLGYGFIAHELGDHQGSANAFAQALELCRELGDKPQIAKALDNLGIESVILEDYDKSRLMLQESLALYQQLGNTLCTAWVINHLAFLAYTERDYDQAVASYTSSLSLMREVHDQHGTALTMHGLGKVCLIRNEDAKARDLHGDGLRIWHELGNRRWLAASLEALSACDVKAGRTVRAATLLGAAQRIRDEVGSPLQPAEASEHQNLLATLGLDAGGGDLQQAWESGKTLSPEDAVKVALSLSTPHAM